MADESAGGGETPFVVPVTADGSEWLVFQPPVPLEEDEVLGRLFGSGWALFRSGRWDETDYRRAFVRFAHDRALPPEAFRRDADDRLRLDRDHPEARSAFAVIREMHITFHDGIGPRLVRELPLARIEAAVNQPAYRADVLDRSLTPNVAHIPFRPLMPFYVRWLDAKPSSRRRPNLKLRIPEGRGRPDSFYAQVAERFAYLTTASQSPATDLAQANGVPTTTVHGWVKEARRRGLLPAGERSKGSE